jgi:hypothetical protein
VIGTASWISMFRAAGFITIPYGLAKPSRALTVFRGATAERSRGMSWTIDVNRAEQFRQRHSWHAPTAIYQATVEPEALLAFLQRPGEGPPEVIADPQMLTSIRRHGPLHPQRRRQEG